MANNIPKATYDFSTTRAPVTGDIREYHNPHTFEQVYEIFDGKVWKEIELNAFGAPYMNSTVGKNINGGSSITTSSVASLGTVTNGYASQQRQKAQEFKEEFFEFMKENMRVAEYVDETNKITHVQLQFRSGPEYVWEDVRRVRLKPTDKPY